jgi:hypothetical protein
MKWETTLSIERLQRALENVADEPAPSVISGDTRYWFRRLAEALSRIEVAPGKEQHPGHDDQDE